MKKKHVILVVWMLALATKVEAIYDPFDEDDGLPRLGAAFDDHGSIRLGQEIVDELRQSYSIVVKNIFVAAKTYSNNSVYCYLKFSGLFGQRGYYGSILIKIDYTESGRSGISAYNVLRDQSIGKFFHASIHHEVADMFILENCNRIEPAPRTSGMPGTDQ